METSRACSCYLGVRILLLLFFIPNQGVALIDLRDKYVSQSSNVSTDSYATWAVDGDIDTISHTLCNGDQWWRVDLGTTYRLQRITIVNRNDRHGSRLQGAIVRAGLDADHSQNARVGSPVTYGQAYPGGQTLNFVPDPVVSARYVSVDLYNNCLQLAELRLEEEVIISSGELVDFTCFNENPLLSITTESTFIGGYKGNVALLGDAVTFGRTVSTATGDGLPLCSCIPNPGDGRGTAISRQYMNCPSGLCSCGGTGSSCLYRIGAFYCQIDTGTTVEKITTVTLNSNAVIIPKRQTITVSLGESLTLEVFTTLSPLPDWRWRKTSAEFNGWFNNWFGNQSPTISSVTAADAGVYECHEPGQRGQGRHAIFRVIVRGCPSNMWGPSTGCQNVCPVCYNGGMCHDVTGQCICAPGFSGSNCHIANGRNAWGMNGTLPCTGAEDRHGASCRGRLFCLQDPFGCSCAAGYKGIGCDQECDQPNTFGPYCTQTCHCAEGITCLTDTGECNDPSCTDEYCPQQCASGWKGRNCQVQTPCPPGYYGEICTQRCNCRDNQACNEEMGDCVDGCADGYRGAACDQDGTRAIVSFGQTSKLNAGQPVTVKCETVGNPLPTEDDIILQDVRSNEIDPVRSFESSDFNDYRRFNEYILTGDDAVSGARLTCFLRKLDNTFLPEFLTLDLYEPPSLASAPYAGPKDSTSIKVRWNSWTSAQGRGDGPVLRFEVHYRLRSDDMDDTTYEFVEIAATNTSTALIIRELEVDTEYDFVVVVVREGEGGAGPPSPKATIGTTCANPTTAPMVQLDVVSSTELRLSWQFPPESTWQCSSLQYVQVYRKQSSEVEFPSNTIQYEATGSFTTLGSLAPCTSYDVYVTFTNRDGLYSPGSIIVTATTETTVPGPVTSLRIFNPPGSSHNQLGVSWSSPSADNNCPVDAYIISHSLTRIKACGSSSVDPGTISQRVIVTTLSLNNLKPYSSYSVSVVAVNSAGNSTVSASSEDTSAAVPSFVPTVNVLDSDITSNRIHFTWDEVSCEDLNGPHSSRAYRAELTNFATDDSTTYSTNLEYRTESWLTPCTMYSFQIAVVNTFGIGTYSNATEVTTKTVVPSQVRDLSAEAVDGYPTVLRVRWNRPSGNCPIDHYTVSYDLFRLLKCEYPTSNRIEAGRTTLMEYNITGLFPNSEYSVYVTATTSAGEGSEDYEYVYTAEAAPSEPPRNVINTATLKRGLRFAWQSPSCPGRRGVIVGYTYRLIDLERGGENVTEDTSSSVTDADIDGLVPYTLYSFQVLARTAAGNGPYSDAIKLRTDQAKPPQITSVTTPSGDATSITVQWPRPDPPYGIIIAYYVVYGIVSQGNQSTLQVTEGLNDTVVEVELTGLVADSNYSIQVQAETVVNRGVLSEPVYRITQEGIPNMPSSLRVVSRKQTELSIAWDEPTAPNGQIIKYTVKYRVIDKPYDPDFRPSSEYTDSDTTPEVRGRSILGLLPGTKYEIMVTASTRLGPGPAAVMEAYTEPASDIPAPVAPIVDPKMSTGTKVVISIPIVDNDYVVSYLVKVNKTSSRKRRQSLPVQQEDFGSYDANPGHYWAGEVNKSEHTGTFEIGDNKTYGGYYNPPLQEGATYEIQTGSSSKTDDSHMVALSKPIKVTAGDYGDAPQPPSPEDGGGSIGTIIAVVLVLLIGSFLIFGGVMVVKRRRAQKTAKPFDSVGMTTIDDSKFTKKSPPSPQMKHVASEDALTNMADTMPPEGDLRPAPSNSSTLPADIHRKPTARVTKEKPSSGPVKVDKLSDYVKAKKAKNNEGFRVDYSGLPSDQIHPMDVAKKDENKVKNRYANIIAYDHSRVILDKLDGDPHSDYVNASYIDGYKHPRKYIASQGPNVASTKDMWRMIWQEKTNIIVMVTHLVEGGKKKCEQYWPTTSRSYSGIEVTLESESKLADYIVRAFKVKKGDEERKLMQYHFTSWPDMGLPQYASPLLRFVAVVKEGCAKYPDMGPIIVHCSAGVGRTGTFITIDAMLDQAKGEGQVDVLQFATNMRDRRVRMVQTQEQYMFIFDALLEAFLCGQTWVSVDDLRQAMDRLNTPSPTGRSTLMQDEFSKLTVLQPPAKADRFRGAKDPINANKNRFPDNLPLDRGRPYLMTMGTEQSTNYINASFINGYWKRDQYIITQIPMPNTSIDFWSMVYDYNSSTIVMLNPLDPSDETMDRYWPEKSMSAYGPYSVQLVSVESYDGTICRTFTLDNMNKPKDDAHTVRQFEFQGWSSDAEIPSSAMSLLKLITYLERWLEDHDGPVTVQCLNGVRSSGLFCAILSMLDKIKAEKIVDVFNAVKSVRNTRPSGVASLEQYKYCYDTALMHLQSFDIYENFR
ncbi:receptor-type tyrosine-protein phosphatase F-like [Patiria miniata]|uniref:protein-tyrosine-phosphatase n=1 Tax=Patiria miniata TaxID=46514 RepID=A0A914ARC7_PATMI|nr:receptor-type tyrosine-protein phosphatase F-like [Patiria miniata]